MPPPAEEDSFSGSPSAPGDYDGHGTPGRSAAPLNAESQHVGMQTNGEGGKVLCQVADCIVDLRMTKAYSLKKRLCPDHLQAQAVKRRGSGSSWWRFCQQCGKLEPIEAFDGSKRSCRARLQKRCAHNTAKSGDHHAAYSYYRPRGLPGGVVGDFKRFKDSMSHITSTGQHISMGLDVAFEDGACGYSDDEMMQEMPGEEDDPAAAAAMPQHVPRNGSGELHYHGVAAHHHEAMEAYGSMGAASRAALAAADPAAAAAISGYGMGAGAVSDYAHYGLHHHHHQQQQQYHQQQQQQHTLLHSILMTSGSNGGSADGQYAAMQEVYAAAAAAAGAPGAAQGVTRGGSTGDLGAWAALHGGAAAAAAAVDPAAGAAMPAPAAALAAVCAALADQHQPGMQQQQQQPDVRAGSSGDLHNVLPLDEAGFEQMPGLLGGPSGMQQKESRRSQRQHRKPRVDVKPDPAALAAAAVADVGGALSPGQLDAAFAAANAAAGGEPTHGQGQQQLLGMIKQMLGGVTPQGDAAGAAAGLAHMGGLGSHSGDSVATAAAAGAGRGATSSAGGGSDELARSGANSPVQDSEARLAEDPAAAAAAAALGLGPGLVQQDLEGSAALAALSEALMAASTGNAAAAAAAPAVAGGATGPADAAAAGAGTTLVELGSLLQMGSTLCSVLGSAGVTSNGSLGQELTTRLLTAVFSQSPATAATLMLAQQQQLQQLQASQQQLMKMMAAQQEQQQELYHAVHMQAHAHAHAQAQAEVHMPQQEQQHEQPASGFDALLAAAEAEASGLDHHHHRSAAAAGAGHNSQLMLPSQQEQQLMKRQGTNAAAPHAPSSTTAAADTASSVAEVVSAQLQAMAQQIACTLAPLQQQMAEVKTELRTMKDSAGGVDAVAAHIPAAAAAGLGFLQQR